MPTSRWLSLIGARLIRSTLCALPSQAVSHWEAPDKSLLDGRRGALPEFPLDAIASVELQEWLSKAARGAGVRIDHVAVPMLEGKLCIEDEALLYYANFRRSTLPPTRYKKCSTN